MVVGDARRVCGRRHRPRGTRKYTARVLAKPQCKPWPFGLAPHAGAAGRCRPPSEPEGSLATRGTPAERKLQAKLAVHASWANTDDRAARTAPARAAFADRFERQVDPDGVLEPVERARRAEHARKAHFYALALKSAQARRRKAVR